MHIAGSILILLKRSAEAPTIESALVRSGGGTAVLATSAEQALGLMRDGGINLVIADLAVGIVAADALRRARSGRVVPLLMVSGEAESEESIAQVYELELAEFASLLAPSQILDAKIRLMLALAPDVEAAPGAGGGAEAEKASLARLQESERRFRLIFETAHEGIWMLGAEGIVQLANRRLAEMLDYAVSEIVGRHPLDFACPEGAARLREVFAQCRNGQPAIVEVKFRRKDGKGLWTLMSACALRENGVFIGTLGMFTDITARRVAEERFRLFFESSAAGYVLIDPATGRYLHANRRWCEMLRRTPEELRQLTYRDVTHPDDRGPDLQRFADLFAGRVSELTVEKRYLRSDGTAFWGQITSSLVRDGAGVPRLQLGIVQDISARKKTEEELLESQTRLRLAVEAADLGIYFYNEETGENMWSDRARRIIGLPPDGPVTAEMVFARVHPDDRAYVQAEMEVIRGGRGTSRDFSLEYRVVLPGGIERHVAAQGVTEARTDITGRPVLHLLGTLRDITAVKQSELTLRNKVTERTRALQEKTQQLEGFVYTVAHDLRAPLRSINGLAELLAEELETMSRDVTLGYLERIKAATRRMDALIRDLLAYSRVGQVEITCETVDLRAVLGAVLHDLDGEITRGGARVAVSKELPCVRGERTIVEQAVLNLVSNAIKFTRPGEPPRVTISATAHDGWVRLAVRDEGIGIPPQYHKRIFNVFERLQASRDIPGTGIGLAIVAKGMERLGGRYGVESEPGRGSTFWIELKSREP